MFAALWVLCFSCGLIASLSHSSLWVISCTELLPSTIGGAALFAKVLYTLHDQSMITDLAN